MNNFRKSFDLLFSKKYLFYTNVALGGTFLGLGDVIEQNLNKLNRKKLKENSEKKLLKEISTINYDRTIAMTKTGLIFGCAGHFWYKFLDTKFHGKQKSTVIKKLICEMAIGLPWILATFLLVGYFEKRSFEKTFDSFKKTFHYILIADWCFYVPLQTFNFLYVLPQFRFLYVAVLTLFYDTFLAFILHK